MWRFKYSSPMQAAVSTSPDTGTQRRLWAAVVRSESTSGAYSPMPCPTICCTFSRTWEGGVLLLPLATAASPKAEAGAGLGHPMPMIQAQRRREGPPGAPPGDSGTCDKGHVQPQQGLHQRWSETKPLVVNDGAYGFGNMVGTVSPHYPVLCTWVHSGFGASKLLTAPSPYDHTNTSRA
jgi:hypothetical protein